MLSKKLKNTYVIFCNDIPVFVEIYTELFLDYWSRWDQNQNFLKHPKFIFWGSYIWLSVILLAWAGLGGWAKGFMAVGVAIFFCYSSFALMWVLEPIERTLRKMKSLMQNGNLTKPNDIPSD